MRIPGFVDLQVNGYGGIDLNDPATESRDVLEMAEMLGQRGTAGFLATIITNTAEVMERCVATVARAMKEQPSPGRILGIHLEGPFISSAYGYRGIHPEKQVRPPDLAWFQRIQRISEGNVRMVTLAPELPGALGFIRAVAGEVIVSAGHTNCSYGHARRAMDEGLTMATHLGNGCRQTIDRHNNPIVNLLACPDLILSFISDGFHLPEAFIRLIFTCRPVQKLIAVSDSSSLAGMDAGAYSWNGQDVVLREDGKLHLRADENVLAGSSYCLLQCMNYLASLNLLTEDELWQVGCLTALRVLGLRPQRLERPGQSLRYDSESRTFELR